MKKTTKAKTKPQTENKGAKLKVATTKPQTPKFTIIKDTREQKGWEFEESEVCAGMEAAALKSGDYSIAGLEDVLSFERKGSTTELATNLSESRFEAELERLSHFPFTMIICEFPLSDLLVFPAKTAIPAAKKRFIKKRGPYLLKQVTELYVRYRVPFLFFNNPKEAQAFVLSVMKRVWENHVKTES